MHFNVKKFISIIFSPHDLIPKYIFEVKINDFSKHEKHLLFQRCYPFIALESRILFLL